MNNLHVRHSVPRVLTLGTVRPARRVYLVPSAVRHVLAAVTADVTLTQEYVSHVILDIMDQIVINSVNVARILVVTRTEPATIATIQMCMD